MKSPVKINAPLGFTTVELLVGLFLSLFIIGLSLTYFISSARTFKLTTNESVVQENGRFALEYIASSMRHAGVNPNNNIAHEMQTIFSGSLCSSGEGGLADGEASTSACTRDGANNSTQNNSDQVAIDYVIDASKETSTLTATGCNGHAIDVPAGQELHVASVYWTGDLDNDEVRSLYCQTLNLETNLAEGAPLPVVNGVERLQVQFGVDADGDGIVERYLSFTNLGAANTTRVRSMRVALLITSGLLDEAAETEFSASTKTFQLLDGASESFSGSQLYRQTFSTTVMVHNLPIDVFANTP